MPNMDGTGPRQVGQRMHNASGMHRAAGHGHHHGQGHGCCDGQGRGMHAGNYARHSGCRCGLGPCATENKAILETRRDALKQSLDTVEKRLQAL